MAELDFSNIKAEDLEMRREPRKSRFTVVHKPTGTVGENPVSPGSHTEARFRKPTNLPKENRVANMDGYVEGVGDDDKGFWPIIKGDEPKNEYLVALVADPEALKITFGQGQPAEAVKSTADTPAPAATVADEDELKGDSGSSEPQDATPVEDSDLAELDDILAGLDPA